MQTITLKQAKRIKQLCEEKGIKQWKSIYTRRINKESQKEVKMYITDELLEIIPTGIESIKTSKKLYSMNILDDVQRFIGKKPAEALGDLLIYLLDNNLIK